MTQRYFCTLFDSNYLVKGVAMLRSLRRHCADAHVYVLCMDRKTDEILSKLAMPGVTLISLREIEDDRLREAKRTRGPAEYCWTLSPCLPWYVLQKHAHVDFLTYLDADLYFYSDVSPLFDEIGEHSIAIIEHRFPARLKHLEINGRFCVEWVSFKRDKEGMACLSRWRDQCLEWCYYRLEEGRMGDQKYLDEWPSRHPSSLHILQHVGAGVAPWNYAQYRFGVDAGRTTVDGAALIFYHFHQFQLLDNGGFDRLSSFYTADCPEPSAVYEEYEASIRNVISDVRAVCPGFSAGFKPAARVTGRRWAQRFVPAPIKSFLRNFVRH